LPEGWLVVLQCFWGKQEGQGLVEYGLILVLIMVVVVAVMTVFGGKVSGMFSSINSGFG
jgi:pilus assembly protein Flp/PilA